MTQPILHHLSSVWFNKDIAIKLGLASPETLDKFKGVIVSPATYILTTSRYGQFLGEVFGPKAIPVSYKEVLPPTIVRKKIKPVGKGIKDWENMTEKEKKEFSIVLWRLRNPINIDEENGLI